MRENAKGDVSLGIGEFMFWDRTRYDGSEDVTGLGWMLYSHVSARKREGVTFGLNGIYHIERLAVKAHLCQAGTSLQKQYQCCFQVRVCFLITLPTQ